MVAIIILSIALVVTVFLALAFRRSPGIRARIGGVLSKPLGPSPKTPPITTPPMPPRLKWNWGAFLLGPLWYLFHGLWVHFITLAGMILLSGGLLLPFVWAYCTLKADEDLLDHRLTRFSVY